MNGKLFVYAFAVLAITGCGSGDSAPTPQTNSQPVSTELACSFAVSNTTLPSDEWLNLSATASGGTAPYSFSGFAASADVIIASTLQATDATHAGARLAFRNPGGKMVTAQLTDASGATALCSIFLTVTQPALSCTLNVVAQEAALYPLAPYHYFNYLVTASVPASAGASNAKITSLSVDGVQLVHFAKSDLQWEAAFVNGRMLQPVQKGVTIEAVIVDDNNRSAVCSSPATVWAY